jgi:hypothetical protein
MCADIMFLCNSLIYDNRMRCANDYVSQARLTIPNIAAVKDTCAASPTAQWMLHALDPAATVVFFDTDQVIRHRVDVTYTDGRCLGLNCEAETRSQTRWKPPWSTS